MRSFQFTLFALTATLLAANNSSAEIVTVTATGEVFFNAIGDAPLSGVAVGDHVEITFTVDSNNFVDSVPGDIRVYEIDQTSFSINFDTPLSLGLLNPYPVGETPYFGVIDGFPVSDGFFVSDFMTSPGGVDLEQIPFNANLDLGYEGSTLSSTDILDAVGVYGFGGLTRFGFDLWSVFPDNVALGIDFEQLTIARSVPEPSTLVILGPLGVAVLCRRRRG